MKQKDFYNQLTLRNCEELKELLPNITVGIAGCGGLGSNVAQMLTRSGIGKLILADFDAVAVSNLNRQFYFIEDIGKNKVDALKKNLKKINSCINIETRNIKITGDNLFSIFNNTPIIVEAFDQAKEKTMIINRFLAEENKDIYLVSASGMGGIESSNIIKTAGFSNNIFICGDFINDSSKGIMSPRVTLTAAHQANMVLRIIQEQFTP